MKKVTLEELVELKRFKVAVNRVQSVAVQTAFRDAGYTWRHSDTLKVRDSYNIKILYFDDFVNIGKFQLSWTGESARDTDWFKYHISEEVELV